MNKELQFVKSADRKFSLAHIRNVGFLNDHLDSVYNAMAGYDPNRECYDNYKSDLEDVYIIEPNPIISISLSSGGSDYKYNFFRAASVRENIFPYIADGVVCPCLIQKDGNFYSEDWRSFLKLRNKYHMSSFIVLESNDNVLPDDFYKIVEKMKSLHKINAVPLIVPAGDSKVFDVVGRKCFSFDEKGNNVECPVPEDFSAELEKLYSSIVAAAAEHDETLMEDFLADRIPDEEYLRKVLRKCVLAGEIVPVIYAKKLNRKYDCPSVCGAKLIFDAIADYFPSPADKSGCLQDLAEKSGIRYCCDDAPFSAVVFARDRIPDFLSLRVLSGSLQKGVPIVNSRTGKEFSLPVSETIFSGDTCVLSRCMTYNGDSVFRHTESYFEIPENLVSEIGVGDVLCDRTHPAALHFPLSSELVWTMSYHCSGKTSGALISALEEKKLNYPGIHIFKGHGTETTVVGMDVSVSYLSFLYCGGNAFEAAEKVPEVLCRERLHDEVSYEYGSADSGSRCVLNFIPGEPGSGITVSGGDSIPETLVNAVREGVLEAAWDVEIPNRYPVCDFHVEVLDCFFKRDFSATIFRRAGYDGLKFASENNTDLLEPVGKMTFCVKEEDLSNVITEISSLSGVVSEIVTIDNIPEVRLVLPLAKYFKLISCLRAYGGAVPEIIEFRFEPVSVKKN
ncbi:MAG: hypothetical protein IJW23_12270 [Lentisphaeria bacterium]|nr:hypothetical protein [Lentisphaeria bacterium]